jgi:hypothetical protein
MNPRGSVQRSSPSPPVAATSGPANHPPRTCNTLDGDSPPLPSHGGTPYYPSQTPHLVTSTSGGSRRRRPTATAPAASPPPQRRPPNPSQGNTSHRPSPTSLISRFIYADARLHGARVAIPQRFGAPTRFCCVQRGWIQENNPSYLFI